MICSRAFGGVAKSFAVVKHFHCVCFMIFEIVILVTDNGLEIKYMMAVLVLAVIPALATLQPARR